MPVPGSARSGSCRDCCRGCGRPSPEHGCGCASMAASLPPRGSPSSLTFVAREGRHRTHDLGREMEAYGCATATLVSFAGLEAMLARQTHIARIAEHFAVEVDVVQERIGATNLDDLIGSSSPLFSMAMVSGRGINA